MGAYPDAVVLTPKNHPSHLQEQELELYITEEVKRRTRTKCLLSQETLLFREEVVATVKKNCAGM